MKVIPPLKATSANTRVGQEKTSCDQTSRVEACWPSVLPPPQTYPVGIGLFSQGANAQEAYFVEEGLIKLTWVGAQGHEFIVGLRSRGSFVGLAPVILNGVHPVSATTITPSKLARVPANFLLNLLKSNSEIAVATNEMLSQEVCDQATRMAELGCLSSRERVKRMLRQILQLSQREVHNSSRETRFLLPLRQCDLASMLAITPEHLCRILKQLRTEGAIRWHKGWLVIPDVGRLSA